MNGRSHPVQAAWLGESLLSVLRDRLGLPGSKNACEQGECGSCSVLVDGVLVCSCLELAAAAVGCSVTTVEGIGGGTAPGEGALTDLQQHMLDHGAVQCGFCTPGIVVAAHELLDREPEPTELQIREALAGNLCRCTGYGRIIEAIRSTAEDRRV
ncbi:MAG: (2Fe-2S)-binding protein [Actinomycetota bacterium]|nr:(2Fe-2S)-binding protein [Actinomycetota bacterium]